VPVTSIGGTLKARMYDTPITVPGIANDSIVPKTRTRPAPTNFCRVRRYADQDAERRGERRRDRGELDRRPERVPSGAGPDETGSRGLDRETP
jgi:hypothetical protein